MIKTATKFLARSFWALLSLSITLMILLSIVYTYLEFQLPDVSVLKDVHMQVPLRIYSSNNELIAQYGSLRRVPVSLKQIPPNLIKAVLATEDARYYEHPGVDFVGIIRAAVAVITTGRKVQGASTITMQVARNFFLSRKKTYGRKIREILLALKIDKELSKDKVLELYLNKVYFGKQAYGVAAAAQVYYGKTLDQLSLAQMAMIAGLPQAPSRNNPVNNPKQALKRRNHVLWRMKKVGFINQAQYNDAINQHITASYHGRVIQVHAPYFAEMVRQAIINQYGEKAYDEGLSVYTTLSPALQQDADATLQQGLIDYSKRHGFRKPTLNLGDPATSNLNAWQKRLLTLGNPGHLIPAAVVDETDQTIIALVADGSQITIPWRGLKWARPKLQHGWVGNEFTTASQIAKPGDVIWVSQNSRGDWSLSQLPQVQGALISVDPQNGAILALSGGFNYNQSNFNRVTQAQRQPGSGFKPFIYSAALNKGYTLASIINDAPIVIKDSGENSLWRPHNDTNKFYGPTRLKVGLAKSRNLVSIRLLQAIGIDYTLDYIKRFGFNPANMPHTLSLALGSGSVTPMEMASAYSTIANGGYRITPFFINKVIDQSNAIVYQQKNKVACENCFSVTESAQPNIAPRVLTPQNAYLMNNALQSVIEQGTGRAAKILKRHDLAGKTGTTNNQVDAWFTGYNSNVLTSIWVGFDNLTPVHEYGAQAALPIWIDYMKKALSGQPEAKMQQPPNILTARIDSRNGLLAPPGDSHVMFEQFRKNHLPQQYATTNHAANKAMQSDTTQTQTPQNNEANGPIF